jgi:hypothetical protein
MLLFVFVESPEIPVLEMKTGGDSAAGAEMRKDLSMCRGLFEAAPFGALLGFKRRQLLALLVHSRCCWWYT